MTSPAQRHRERIHAEQAQANAAASGSPVARGSAYDLMRAKLAEDQRKLKSIQSLEQKIALKARLLPEYAPWIEGVLAADKPTQDDVFGTTMVWHIDTGDIEGALIMAAHMLKHSLKLPEQYQRDLATLVVEEIADRAQHAPDTVTAEQLLQTGALTDALDMPDEVRAKLHKATGLALRECAPAQALEHMQRALQLNPRIGLKAEIGKLEKQLAAAT